MTDETLAEKEGGLFVVAAPSGAGKTSLVNALLDAVSGAEVTISHTTRPMRTDERDGVNYHFVTEPAFEALRADGGFIESARVFGNLYGTSKAEVERVRRAGKHVILEIDWQGAQQIRRTIPSAQTIFILPPSLSTLRERLQARGQDDPGTIERRMNEAISEMSHYHEFDYLVVNERFEDALAELVRIVAGDAADLRLAVRRPLLADLLADLLP